ncbi:MAG: hypothetical protein BroJett011_27660 [Chloroflexota bacterium]|nr:MAG: hypothetical protein BroJett011_27660 [Chloroflexota bacterium]
MPDVNVLPLKLNATAIFLAETVLGPTLDKGCFTPLRWQVSQTTGRIATYLGPLEEMLIGIRRDDAAG